MLVLGLILGIVFRVNDLLNFKSENIRTRFLDMGFSPHQADLLTHHEFKRFMGTPLNLIEHFKAMGFNEAQIQELMQRHTQHVLIEATPKPDIAKEIFASKLQVPPASDASPQSHTGAMAAKGEKWFATFATTLKRLAEPTETTSTNSSQRKFSANDLKDFELDLFEHEISTIRGLLDDISLRYPNDEKLKDLNAYYDQLVGGTGKPSALIDRIKAADKSATAIIDRWFPTTTK